MPRSPRDRFRLVLVLALLGAPHAARADRQEWQLSPAGVVGAASVQASGRSVWSLAGGARVRAAYGITDWFQLGVHGQFTTTQGISFPGVVMAGQPGTLVGDLWTVELALDLRLVGDIALTRAFARFHPFVGVRGGGLLRILKSQSLVDDHNLLLFHADDSLSFIPTVTGYLGAEYRIRKSWVAGVVGSFTYGPNYYAATGSIEISWMTY